MVVLILFVSLFYAKGSYGAIDPVSPSNITVEVGTTFEFFVQPTNIVPDQLPVVWWRISPDSSTAANMLTPSGGEYSREFEFLEPGFVTIVATNSNALAEEFSFELINTQVSFAVTIVDSNGTLTPEENNSETEAETPTNATSSSLNQNQRNAQTLLDQVCSALPDQPDTPPSTSTNSLGATCDAIELQNDLEASFDRITAEEIFAMSDTLTYTADQQNSNIQARIHAVREGKQQVFDVNKLSLRLWDQTIGGEVLSAGAQALTGESGGGASDDSTITTALSDSSIGIFASGTLSFGDVDGDDIQRNASSSTTRLTIGADYRMDNARVIGIALGIVNDDSTFDNDNGNLEMQGFGVSTFGSWYEQDKGYADIILDISQNDFTLSRRIDLPEQNTEYANSRTDSQRVALSINAGRTFQRGATEFGPLFRISIMRASIDGFQEQSSLTAGGAGTTLDVDSQTVSSARFSVGAELKRIFNTSKAVFIPSAKLELEVENKNDKGVITASFLNDPEASRLQLRGTERDKTAIRLSVGTSATLVHGQSAYIFYESRLLDERISQQRISLGYRMHF